jgi:hypothetical protein
VQDSSTNDEYLWRYHLDRYYGEELASREEALRFFLAQGDTVVSWLLEELSKKREACLGRKRPTPEVLHLAGLLCEIGSPQGLVPLLEINEPLGEKLLQTLAARGSDEDIRALLTALERWTPSGVSAITLGLTPQKIRVALGRALVAVAERTGNPLCQAAFQYIGIQPLHPVEFIECHRRLKAALPTLSLPIPVTVAQRTEGLPIPAKKTASEE